MNAYMKYLPTFFISFLVIPLFIIGHFIGVFISHFWNFWIQFIPAFNKALTKITSWSETGENARNLFDLIYTYFIAFTSTAFLLILICVTTGFIAGKLTAFIINIIYKKYYKKLLIVIPFIYTLFMCLSFIFPLPYMREDMNIVPINLRLEYLGSYIAIFCFFAYDILIKDNESENK